MTTVDPELREALLRAGPSIDEYNRATKKPGIAACRQSCEKGKVR